MNTSELFLAIELAWQNRYQGVHCNKNQQFDATELVVTADSLLGNAGVHIATLKFSPTDFRDPYYYSEQYHVKVRTVEQACEYLDAKVEAVLKSSVANPITRKSVVQGN